MKPNNISKQRILSQLRKWKQQKLPNMLANPLQDDIYTWHFTFQGPENTEFHEGIYHGQILLPYQYPFKPPDIVFMNKNGRFETSTKICLTITQYHPEEWNSAWTIRTMLEAVISLFAENIQGVGSLAATKDIREFLARTSHSFACEKCGPIKNLLPPRLPKGQQQLSYNKKVDQPSLPDQLKVDRSASIAQTQKEVVNVLSPPSFQRTFTEPKKEFVSESRANIKSGLQTIWKKADIIPGSQTHPYVQDQRHYIAHQQNYQKHQNIQRQEVIYIHDNRLVSESGLKLNQMVKKSNVSLIQFKKTSKLCRLLRRVFVGQTDFIKRENDLCDLVYNMNQTNKKEDIILEFGSEWIRVGLVGDRVPRKTLKTGNLLNYPSASASKQVLDKYQKSLQELFFNIFFSHINCSSTGKTVIILERVFMDRKILSFIAQILFRKLKIERMQFALSCVTPLYLTARYSGLVISAGASTIQIMPIFQGYPLFKNFKSQNMGTSTLNKFLRDDIYILNKQTPMESLKTITQEQLNQIRYSHSMIGASSNPIAIPIKKMRLKFIPEKIKLGIFFGDYENQEYNLAYAFLSVLNEIHVDCFDSICKNIVFAGGFWRIKGMQKYFKMQIKQILPKFPSLEKRDIRHKLSFVSWNFNPSEISWIGASIGSSIRSIEHMSLLRKEFEDKQKGFMEKMMKSYFLSC